MLYHNIDISLMQENGHIKCHQYYPADDRPSDSPNFVQFDQVRQLEYNLTSSYTINTHSIGLAVSL